MAQSSFKSVSPYESSSSFLPASSSTTTFCYPPRRPYVARLNRNRSVPRRSPLYCTPYRYSILFCGFSFFLLFIGSLWILFSFYATENVHFGRNVSLLYRANSLFVTRIKVTNELQNQGLIVYGLPKTPLLNKEMTWTEAYDMNVLNGGYQGWDFWLNMGSQVTIQYNISDSRQELAFVVIAGEEKMRKWLQDPNDIDIVSSWKTVQGTGDIQYHVEMNERYLFSFLNTNSEVAEVDVNITVRSKLHDTDAYKSKCTSMTCEVHLDFLGSNVLLLTTKTFQVIEHKNSLTLSRFAQEDIYSWSVDLTFEQRWLTYMFFWGAMGFVMLVLYIFCRPPSQEMETSQQNNESSSGEASVPVIFVEEDKVDRSKQSVASSLLSPDTELEDPEAVEDFMCIICFDQRRNCFFDPCGHCATCYSCSKKILKNKKASCPLCRQQVQVVRKLFLH